MTDTTLISGSGSEETKCWIRTGSILKRARALDAKSGGFDHRSFQTGLDSIGRLATKYLGAVET